MDVLRPRQIHLDFHTSGDIPGIAADFDAALFARTMKEAHVASATVFARCHHGYLYYPSKLFPERVHPHLSNPNLMIEQVDALHAEGIRAPIYITVQWDYAAAISRPEWLIRKRDGAHEGPAFTEPGFYQSLCVNTTYGDYLAAQTREAIELLGDRLDGVFFDIVSIRPCLCAACRAMMKQRGLDASNDKDVRTLAIETNNAFKKRMTALVRSYSADCTIFYNAGHIGPCTRASIHDYSHLELESLPSGSWGYLHFPVSARYASGFGIDCMGMTGKFHTEWGDFHSLKNLAALEFECFRILSRGFAVIVGDQLEPSGVLNPATYRLVGKVYEQIARREEWARPSVSMAEAAVLTPEPTDVEFRVPDSIMGATQMLEELAVQFDIIDDTADLSKYKLVILPDDFIADAAMQNKLDAYAAAGGSILACHKGGSDETGAYPRCFGARPGAVNENYPDFIMADGPLASGLELDNEYVIYMQGLRLEADTADVVMRARAPFFPRKGDTFCSHRYTPSAKGECYPAALQNGRVILFAHPLFKQYRHNAPRWCKQLVQNAINSLLPNRLVTHDGPSTMTVSLLDQPAQNRVTAHLLTYVPVRKSASIDIIEERTKQANVTLAFRLPGKSIQSARLVPEDIPLPLNGCSVTVPEIDGYAIVELRYAP